jgi:hypothetical protein
MTKQTMLMTIESQIQTVPMKDVDIIRFTMIPRMVATMKPTKIMSLLMAMSPKSLL